MRKITDFLVNHCYTIFVVFLVITGICGFLATKVTINKDIYSYMPADSETSLGLGIMNDEFDYDKTSSYEMMLTDVPADEKLKIKEFIESVDGIDSVDYDDSDEYNRDQYTRYKINLGVPADSEDAQRIYNTIHDKYVDEYELAESGQVHTFNGAVLKIPVALLAIAFALVILLVMSKSWIEPVLFFISIMLAVVMNKGTNIIFPNVSHITDAIAAILQMALSMDYAIMLSTRYRQEKQKKDCPDKFTAMRRAMRYSFGAISSSSVTTVVGLMMLIFMSFAIGRDMGLVLSKGVVLSLVSIFTSLPALLLLFDKVVDKTEKKTINFNMAWLGKYSYGFHFVALPIFIVIFVGAFLLKGTTAIDFTGSQNNKIKDVFSETNQLALVYDAKMDKQVTELCNRLDKSEQTTRVLCYGNTINEELKYDQVVPKVNKLSQKDKIDTEDYLIKVLYYRFYKDVDAHQISLTDFVNFLQRDVFPDEHFVKDLTPETINKINQFSYFTDQKKVKQLRGKNEIAGILGVEPSKLDDLFVLYFADQGINTKLTTYQFSNFVLNEVLADEKYASMITASQKSDLAKLQMFSNSTLTNTPKTAAELAKMFGLNQATVDQVFVYYNYTTTATPTVGASVDELVNFALTNENVLGELGLSKEQAANIRTQIANAKKAVNDNKSTVIAQLDTAIANMPEETEEQKANKQKVEALRAQIMQKLTQTESVINGKYTYSDIEGAAGKIDTAITNATTMLANLDLSEYDGLTDEQKGIIENYAHNAAAVINAERQKINLNSYLEKLKNIYKLYQAETTANTTKISAKTLVDFLIAHAGDDKIKASLTPALFSQLQQAQFIMNNQKTAYSYGALSATFRLDSEKVKLVYSLYEYRHVNTEPQISLRDLVYFIDEKVLPNPEYASRLGEAEQTKLAALATLTRSAEAGVLYNHESLYRAIKPLAGNFDKNKLYLAYLYHGSLYDYDENWTLTLETFVNYLTDNILPDSHFASMIDADKQQKIKDGRDTINDAKGMLVGPKHYRALIETELPAEGEETFNFIKGIKDELGSKNKIDYFVLGDSAMAYEMSQTFGGEMDFITIITMLAIFAVVVCTFKSVFVSMLLVLVIQCAVWIVMSYLSLTGSSIYFIALIIVQAILMGATIDYAILFTSYYVENRNYFKLSVKDALISTYNKSISAILTSASILIIVTAVVGNFTSAIAGKICQSISLGTFCATIIILFLLPALLATLDKWIIKKKSA